MRIRASGVLGVSVVAVVSAVAGLRADIAPHRVYTRPEPPPREVLDRLNLRLHWFTNVPMDGTRDGLSSVQVLGRDMLVQTRSGLVALLNAETGEARWRARVGVPYRVVGRPAANSHTVLVVSNTFLYGLDRRTGAVQWEFRVPGGGVTTAPVADEDSVYLAGSNGRLVNFLLPRMDLLALEKKGLIASTAEPVSNLYEKGKRSTGAISIQGALRESFIQEPFGPQPRQVWENVTGHLDVPPLLTAELVVPFMPDGTAVALTKIPQEKAGEVEVYHFAADGPIRVRPGQYGDIGYVGSQDTNVYALNLVSGRVLWRYTVGQPVTRRVVALEQDVYVTTEDNGLERLDRADGIALWRVRYGNRVRESNTEADRFLAANPKFVYATDDSGRLLVLDHRLGHRLSIYDTRAFPVPVVNEQTDRLYLAANNGLIVCLHDKEYVKPVRHRKYDEGDFASVEEKLARKITDPGAKAAPLSAVLDGLRAKYNLAIVIAEPKFQEANRDSPANLPVDFPKVENRPLSEVLRQILDKVNATYEIVGEDIVVIPAKGKPKAN
jgi:outer membrane protein assembly factor BamB